MAATVKATKSYDAAGSALGPTREDLQDIIYDISPMDTWFLSRVERLKARSTVHEWLTDSLKAPAINARIEGDTFSASSRAVPSRLKNYTQISTEEFEVTGTLQATDNAGMREMMAYNTARAGKDLKRSMEVSMLQISPASAGTSVSPRVSASIPSWIYTDNHIKAGSFTVYSTTAPASGFATATCPGASTTAFSSTYLSNMLAQAWSCGGEVDTILCPASAYTVISGFTSIATRFRDVASRQQAQIIGAADVYVSAYGTHNIVLSRYMTPGHIFALDSKTWGVAYLRPFQTIEIAKVGDAERRMILAEWTLVAKSPLANAQFRGAS